MNTDKQIEEIDELAFSGLIIFCIMYYIHYKIKNWFNAL